MNYTYLCACTATVSSRLSQPRTPEQSRTRDAHASPSVVDRLTTPRTPRTPGDYDCVIVTTLLWLLYYDYLLWPRDCDNVIKIILS
jgi:hypothetical protein